MYLSATVPHYILIFAMDLAKRKAIHLPLQGMLGNCLPFPPPPMATTSRARPALETTGHISRSEPSIRHILGGQGYTTRRRGAHRRMSGLGLAPGECSATSTYTKLKEYDRRAGAARKTVHAAAMVAVTLELISETDKGLPGEDLLRVPPQCPKFRQGSNGTVRSCGDENTVGRFSPTSHTCTCQPGNDA